MTGILKVNTIQSPSTNADITLDPNGTGDVVVASGNVGIGNSNPSSFYSLADNIVLGTGSGGHGLTIYSGSSDSGYIGFNDTASASMQGFIQYNHNGDYMAFAPNGSEKVRIDSSGDLLVGCIALPTTNVPGLGVDSSNDGELRCSVSSTGNSTQQRFLNPNGEVGAIRTNGTATSYLTSSDYRLKENVVADWDATTRLKQLNPVRFNFIADADTTVDGFLAHEVQTVVPEAISGTHDEVDDDDNPVYQGIDQSKLVPLLTGALQEAIAKIEALETRIAALEAS